MAIGKRITDLGATSTVSDGSNYLVETSAGTQRIRHDDLSKQVGKTLNFGTLSGLNTNNKTDLVTAINEANTNAKAVFTGTDGVNAGTSGNVPAPVAADNGKFLKSNGKWESPSSVISVSASNVTFSDGKTAQAKVGNIDGITDDVSSENSRVAASSKSVKTVNDKVGKINLYIGSSDGKLHFVNGAGADTVIPFSGNISQMSLIDNYIMATNNGSQVTKQIQVTKDYKLVVLVIQSCTMASATVYPTITLPTGFQLIQSNDFYVNSQYTQNKGTISVSYGMNIKANTTLQYSIANGIPGHILFGFN